MIEPNITNKLSNLVLFANLFGSFLIFGSKGLELFVCGDQLLKGAALNAVQIAELLLERF